MRLIDGPYGQKAKAKNKPLRSTQELAEEFGVSTKALAAFMRQHADAPKPNLTRKDRGLKMSWYEPDKVRAWWKKLQVEKRAWPT